MLSLVHLYFGFSEVIRSAYNALGKDMPVRIIDENDLDRIENLRYAVGLESAKAA
jgi:hypothetical protein